MNSLEVSDAQAAAVQKTPHRVTLDSLNALVATEQYLNPEAAAHVTVCIMTLTNGFVLIGHSAPADPGNFNAQLGRDFARNECIRQMWPLEGYRLRSALADAA